MKRSLTPLLILAIFIASISGTYLVTKHYSFQHGYQNGTDIAFKTGYQRGIIKGYDTGFNAADSVKTPISTANCPQYDPFHIYSCTNTDSKQVLRNIPVHCSSYTYGISNKFTDTDCY